MNDPTPHDDRIRELLAERALFGLSEEEMGELHTLTDGRHDEVDDLAFAAAALDLANYHAADQSTALPEHVRQRTLEAVRRQSKAGRGGAVAPLNVPGSLERQPTPRASRRELFAWAVAAAALALAAFPYFRQPPVDLRGDLLALRERGEDEVVEVAWTPSADDAAAKGAKGEVLWSDKLNRGVMVFRGLAPNDPKQNQYQLWIFDANRSADHPVDGGVFDIPAGAEEVVVPMDPRVPVSKATLFAVSVEKPGGVVVSDRSRLPLTAAVPADK